MFTAVLESCPPSPAVRYYAQEALYLLENDLSKFMDTYAIPFEQDFEVEEIHDVLARSGLDFLSWVNAGQWDLTTRLTDPTIQTQWKALDQKTRSVLASIWDYDFSPYCTFYAAKHLPRQRARPPFSKLQLQRWSAALPRKYYVVSFQGQACQVEEMPFDLASYPRSLWKALQWYMKPRAVAAVFAQPRREKQFWELLNLEVSPLTLHERGDPSVGGKRTEKT